jgi:hypothetical protein
VLASVIVGAGALMVASLAIAPRCDPRRHAVRNDATDDRVLVTGRSHDEFSSP